MCQSPLNPVSLNPLTWPEIAKSLDEGESNRVGIDQCGQANFLSGRERENSQFS